jgi:hypothetical protein
MRYRGCQRLTAAAAAAALVVGCTSDATPHPDAQRATASTAAVPRPSFTPAASVWLRHGFCARHIQVPPGPEPKVLPEHPVAVLTEWMPGFDQRPCRVSTEQYGTKVAGKLRRDINAAQPLRQMVMCPYSDRSTVVLTFGYRSGPNMLVAVDLRGCNLITGLAGPARWKAPRLLPDLVAVAPQPWHAALKQWMG